MLAQGLALLLAEQPDLTVVEQFADGQALLTWLGSGALPPADVLLLDLHLPGVDGLTLLPQLRQQWPALRVLVFSNAAAPELVDRLIAAGASGFVPKSADAEQLLTAIRAVGAGGTVFPKHARAVLAQASTAQTDPLLRLHRLSGRERQVISLVRQGLTTREIAERLCLAEFTISTHRRNIMHKLELGNVAALVQFAIDYGL
ncbi:DNA-binding response regulator [Hymenobacter cavernae]|uniref:DNA-binding response regulator n=2 Tax=Hymenobacter cavernae TaxID=2044852 RepID=A0ABQ1TL73_9BACT|nr:DNA-binding response regulator [Hymenobacter cavernae]